MMKERNQDESDKLANRENTNGVADVKPPSAGKKGKDPKQLLAEQLLAEQQQAERLEDRVAELERRLTKLVPVVKAMAAEITKLRGAPNVGR